jgi:hypothetical protein
MSSGGMRSQDIGREPWGGLKENFKLLQLDGAVGSYERNICALTPRASESSGSSLQPLDLADSELTGADRMTAAVFGRSHDRMALLMYT